MSVGGQRETAQRKQQGRLTCGYGEIPRFCLLAHLAEVCTYFSLNALCPMPHQNPQSQLQRKGERKNLSRVVEKDTHASIWKSEFFILEGIF